MNNLDTRIKAIKAITHDPRFIAARVKAENVARTLLENKAGKFTETDIELFCKLCNNEFVPKNGEWRKQETNTRFGLSFKGQNVNLIKNCLDSFNQGVNALWNNSTWGPVLNKFWNDDVKGAGTGMPTMILYLKDPSLFNIWNKNLEVISNELWEIPHSTNRWQNYSSFNNVINENLRKRYSLLPYEIDYVIFSLGEKI